MVLFYERTTLLLPGNSTIKVSGRCYTGYVQQLHISQGLHERFVR